MEEVLTRRLTAYLDERGKPASERPGKFAYPPQLLLVDGGKGQLNVAVRVLEELGLAEEIPVASLPRRSRRSTSPGWPDPVRVPRGSEALYLLQRIRDEAHRFAITYHRELRGKRDDRLGARRDQGPRPHPPQAAEQGAGRRGRGQGGLAGRPPGPDLAPRRRRRRGLRQDPRPAVPTGEGRRS
jgi:hypothetical protein